MLEDWNFGGFRKKKMLLRLVGWMFLSAYQQVIFVSSYLNRKEIQITAKAFFSLLTLSWDYFGSEGFVIPWCIFKPRYLKCYLKLLGTAKCSGEHRIVNISFVCAVHVSWMIKRTQPLRYVVIGCKKPIALVWSQWSHPSFFCSVLAILAIYLLAWTVKWMTNL